MFDNWTWLQWAMAIAYAIYVTVNIAKHGEKKPETYNGFAAIFATALWVCVLDRLGFWR